MDHESRFLTAVSIRIDPYANRCREHPRAKKSALAILRGFHVPGRKANEASYQRAHLLAPSCHNDHTDPRFPLCGEALRPLRLRSLLLLAVNLEIYTLVEEAQVTPYLACFRNRLLVAPDKILHAPAPGIH